MNRYCCIDIKKRKCCILGYVGWFYVLKLHIIINDKSEIVAIKITPGNKNNQTVFEEMARKHHLKVKCYGNKGCLSKALFKKIYSQRLHMIISIKKEYEKPSFFYFR